MKTRSPLRLLPLLLATATLAQAHPGHGPAVGWTEGLAHPISGADHLLAMVAVGLWAAQLGGRARWALPLGFTAAMAAGAALGMAGLAFPWVDGFILASVLVLGLLIALAVRLPGWSGIALAALAGVFHGMAHGAEMPVRADGVTFLAGLLAATALLHLSGVGAGLWAGRRYPAAVRWAGAAVLAGGAVLCVA